MKLIEKKAECEEQDECVQCAYIIYLYEILYISKRHHKKHAFLNCCLHRSTSKLVCVCVCVCILDKLGKKTKVSFLP